MGLLVNLQGYVSNYAAALLAWFPGLGGNLFLSRALLMVEHLGRTDGPRLLHPTTAQTSSAFAIAHPSLFPQHSLRYVRTYAYRTITSSVTIISFVQRVPSARVALH